MKNTIKKLINYCVLAGILAIVSGAGIAATPALAEDTALVTNIPDTAHVFFSTAGFTYPVAEAVGYEKSVADRSSRLNNYFEKRDMPLSGYGEQFVRAADSCGLDWRLLPAIGVRESSGGKHLMNNNPFGWGSAKIKYTNFDAAINDVTENLCGNRDSTSSYYKDKTTYQKLWYYNGSVMPSYPAEVIAIMNKF